MRFNTHDRTPKIKTNLFDKIMLTVCSGLMIAMLLFVAIVCSIYSSSIMPAVLILSPAAILAIVVVISQRDMDMAYVENDNDVIRAVDYYFGIKKEKTFSIRAIDSAEILIGRSMRIRGYRYSNVGCTYIVFRDVKGKYMFKIICVPETKEFFGSYMNI